jgi:hypothetical protein
MSVKTLHHSVDYELQFHDRNEAALTVRALELTVDDLNGSLIKCFLSFKVSPELYRRIDTEALFHLDPEVRSAIFGGSLEPDVDVEIQAKLDPQFIFELSMQIKSIKELADHLLKISQTQPADPLMNTESWFALYVKQEVVLPPEIGEGQLKVGYRTTWADWTS